MELADDWIAENYPQYITAYMDLSLQDPKFPKVMFEEKVIKHLSSAKWWLMMEKKTQSNKAVPKGFCRFNANLLSIPPSSAAIERLFSTFGHIWTKSRNRLGEKKAMKLVKCFRALRCKDDPEEYGVDEECLIDA